ITTASPVNYVAGDTVTLANVTDGNYDGTFTIASVNSATNQFTYTDNAITNEPASSGGTVAQVLGTVNSLTASGTSNNMVGVAKLPVVSPSLNAGTNHLFAVYTPTNFYLASTSAVSTVTVAVGTALTQNSLMSSAPTATYGAPLTFTATLKG